MAFDFGSDILADAIRAADPVKADAALAKLENLSKPNSGKIGARFSQVYETAINKTRPPANSDKRAALERYEAAILGTFIQAMMPKETESFFGKGFAGEVWKSQLSQAVAEQLAHRGGIGIASRLLNDFTVDEGRAKPLTGVSDASTAVDRNSSADMVTSFLHKLQLSSLLQNGDANEDSNALVPDYGKANV